MVERLGRGRRVLWFLRRRPDLVRMELKGRGAILQVLLRSSMEGEALGRGRAGAGIEVSVLW